MNDAAPLAYERIADFSRVVQAVESAFCDAPGLFVIWRSAFRWYRRRTIGDPGHSSVIPNAYEMHDVRQVCEDRDWDLIHDFNHIAVVRGAP